MSWQGVARNVWSCGLTIGCCRLPPRMVGLLKPPPVWSGVRTQTLGIFEQKNLVKKPRTSPKLRKYRSADWKSFVALDIETGLAGMRQASAEQKRKFAARWPECLKSTYKWGASGPTTSASALYVIEDDAGEYAGHLWLTEQVDFFTADKSLFVTAVAIASKFRGRGWGRYLMGMAEKVARERGLRSIRLGVGAGNIQACKLYAELGFRTTRLSMERSIVKRK